MKKKLDNAIVNLRDMICIVEYSKNLCFLLSVLPNEIRNELKD